jgi:hypothetical protein
MSEESKPIQFVAEVKEVKSRKTTSLDLIYRLVVESNDPSLLSLGFLSPDTTIKITIEPDM